VRCSAAEVFALPSHQENFGIAVVEALACGMPVLISREVNIWREIVAAGAGLADDDSVEGATRLLRTWLTKPSVEREQMRQQAKECFVERFDIESATQNLLGVFTKRKRRCFVSAPRRTRLERRHSVCALSLCDVTRFSVPPASRWRTSAGRQRDAGGTLAECPALILYDHRRRVHSNST
jgi:hypothetical protein